MIIKSANCYLKNSCQLLFDLPISTLNTPATKSLPDDHTLSVACFPFLKEAASIYF